MTRNHKTADRNGFRFGRFVVYGVPSAAAAAATAAALVVVIGEKDDNEDDDDDPKQRVVVIEDAHLRSSFHCIVCLPHFFVTVCIDSLTRCRLLTENSGRRGTVAFDYDAFKKRDPAEFADAEAGYDGFDADADGEEGTDEGDGGIFGD